MPEPFTIAVTDERLASVRSRLEAFDWTALADAGGWESGVGISDLRRLVDYWLHRYDWRAHEARLNRLPQFIAEIQGQRLHFIHVRGDGSRLPMMLIHGWPGSLLEFEQLIEPLVASGHDVIIPSLPGYALFRASGRTDRATSNGGAFSPTPSRSLRPWQISAPGRRLGRSCCGVDGTRTSRGGGCVAPQPDPGRGGRRDTHNCGRADVGEAAHQPGPARRRLPVPAWDAAANARGRDERQPRRRCSVDPGEVRGMGRCSSPRRWQPRPLASVR